MHPLLGEFLGTMVLLTFGCGVVANVVLTGTKGQNDGWLTIATGWFIGVVMGVFVAQSVGAVNADINPAVTLAKFILGLAYNFPQMLMIILVEIAGAFAGALIVWLAYLPHWKVTEDKKLKLAVFATTPAIRHYPSNLLSEVIGTAVLIIGVGAIFGKATLGHPSTGLGPYLVGLLVWGIGLSLGGQTGYAINPARDLGPRLAHAVLPIANKGNSDWSYAWVPFIGPFIGSLLAAAFWYCLFVN